MHMAAEWDRGKDKLTKYLQQLKYPTINCNLDYGGDDLQHAVQPYITKYVGGHKVSTAICWLSSTLGCNGLDCTSNVSMLDDTLRRHSISNVACINAGGRADWRWYQWSDC